MRRRDLLALTSIFFGPQIVTSLRGSNSVAPTMPEFTSAQNYAALAQQGIQLGVGVGYIACRRLRLRPFSLKPTLRGTLYGLGMFASVGVLYDAFYQLYAAVSPPEDSGDAPAENYADVDLSLLLYSVFNGFYEEFFFLVLCLSVPSVSVSKLFVYSLVVRFAFHTYQGLVDAVGIALIVGGTFFLADRFKPQHRLFAPVLAHSLGDLFGLGILSHLPESWFNDR